jgi:hypothetical protein
VNMKKPKVVVAGCARDCSVHLDRVFKNISRLSSFYPGISLVVVENDSSDDTFDRISAMGKHFLRKSINKIPSLSRQIPLRTQRLAFVRNLIIDILREGKFQDCDIVLMIDFDEVCTDAWDIDELSRAFVYLMSNTQLMACFSNCNGHYYDLWAFRHPKICPVDIWLDAFTYRLTTGSSVEDAFLNKVTPHIFQIPTSLPPFSVDSAFGGMGIYSMNAIRATSSEYVGQQTRRLTLHSGEDAIVRYQKCEHVSFHQGMAAKLGGQFAIIPSLITQDTHRRRFIPEAMDVLAIEVMPIIGTDTCIDRIQNA